VAVNWVDIVRNRSKSRKFTILMLLIDKLILLAGNELRMLSTNAVSTENYNTDIINYKLTN
jgi:hypothetical protein